MTTCVAQRAIPARLEPVGRCVLLKQERLGGLRRDLSVDIAFFDRR